MKIRTAILVLSTFVFSSCTALFWYSMGARGHYVPLERFSSLYYKTSPDLKKVYVFFSIPGQIAIGASNLEGPGNGFARSITIDFASVKENEKNKREFAEAMSFYKMIDKECVWEFEVGNNDPKLPHDKQVKVFYGVERRDRGESIPYRGVLNPQQKIAEQVAP